MHRMLTAAVLLLGLAAVAVARTAGGAPVAVRPGALEVQVAYGTAATTLPLEPGGGGRPGRVRADLEPTRPGTYSFHVTGTAGHQRIDVESTCSPSTFDCVTSGADMQFPVKEPSAAELGARLDRELARAAHAEDHAGTARTLAIVAIALAPIALVAALRSRRPRR